MSQPEQERAVHVAYQSLPEVNIAGLYSAELDVRRTAARALLAACREAGFFYLTGHSRE